MKIARKALFLLLFICAGTSFAAAPTDPKAKKIYDHDREWLLQFPPSFIATNMRGESDTQYVERRQAALDILHEKHDLTTVPYLMDELKRGGFLSGEICDILGEWHAKKAQPLLEEVAADKKRPKEVREKALAAIELLKKPVVEAPRPVY